MPLPILFRPILRLMTLAALAHAAPAVATPCGSEDLLAGKKPSETGDLKNDVARLTDGVVAQEGAQWNAPVVVVLSTPVSHVTYDLGEPREISALYMQGDANDVYKVSGSVDGTPGSFKPLGEFPNTVAKGHGLRARTLEIAPTTVRYLRFGEPAGDGFFSISELAAYCKKPSPFPPRLRVVESMPAQAGDGTSGWPSFLALYAIALGVLGWLAYLLTRSPPAASAAAAPEPPPPTDVG